MSFMAWSIQFIMEIGDGFSDQFGSSWTDLVANTAGAAFGYIGFTIAAIYDHAIFGQPELIVAVMTLTLASMYLLVASLDFFVLSRRRRGNS